MDASRLLTLAQELVRYPTVTPADHGLMPYLSGVLKQIGFDVYLLPFGQVQNLYARYGDRSPVFCFAGHTDVVPVGDPGRWSKDPFCGDISDGVLYGRGTTDMKAAIAAQIEAARSFIQEKPSFPGSIVFLLTGDEEAVAEDGTVKVLGWLRSKKEKIDYALVGEPTCVDKVGDTIKNGRRGSIHGELTLYGVQGHSAYPHLAENPIHRGLPVLQGLVDLSFDRGNDFFPPTHFVLTSVQAGAGATNVIPGELKVTFNLRYGSASSFESIEEKIRKVLDPSGIRYDLKLHHFAKAFVTPPGRLTEMISKALQSTAKTTSRLSTGGGTSDARFFADFGIEVAEMGLVNRNAHKVDESVPTREVELLCQIYKRVLDEIFP